MAQVISNYRPRPPQIALHQRTQRFLVDVLHRRFGKTVYAINKLIQDALCCEYPEPRVYYACPLLKQAKRNAWPYVKLYTQAIPGMRYNNSDLVATFPNGATMELIGADRPDSFRGTYADSFCFDETAQIHPDMWSEVVRPVLADRFGKCHFIGTPKGKFNLFYDMFAQAGELDPAKWARCLLTVDDTGIIDPAEVEDMRREMTRDGDEAKFMQEMYCSWSASIKGAYYGKLMHTAEREGRVGRVPHDPSLPVDTAWDLGMRDATAIWFIQRAGQEIRAIDYREYFGTGLPAIINDLRKLPYNYDLFIGPHDLKVRELGSGQSRLETAARLGVKFHVAKNMPVIDGIDAVRNIIPKMWFDEERCRKGISALSMYHSDYDEQARVYSLQPVHDWSEHGASALRYYAIAMKGGSWSKHRQQLNYDMLNRATV